MIAGGQQGHHQLTGFGDGYPGLLLLAATAQLVLDKFIPARSQPRLGLAARIHPGQHRVEPVHRVPRFARPGAVETLGLVAQGGTQGLPGAAPLRSRFGEGMGDVDGALEAFVNGAAAGDQGVTLGTAIGVHGPVNLTVAGLQGEHEAYRPLDRGPHFLEKIALARHQVVVPHAGGDVGDEIALAPLTVVDLLSPVGGPPAAIRQLHTGQPGIRPPGRLVLAADGQPHGRFHVIPGIGVAAIKPGDFATGQLGVEDKLHRWPQELVGEKPPA